MDKKIKFRRVVRANRMLADLGYDDMFSALKCLRGKHYKKNIGIQTVGDPGITLKKAKELAKTMWSYNPERKDN